MKPGFLLSTGLYTIGLNLMLAATAPAAPIRINNASFESPGASDGLSIAADWSAFPVATTPRTYNPYRFLGGGLYYQSAVPCAPASSISGTEGRMLAFIYDEPAGAGLEQTLATRLEPNTRYELMVAVGRRDAHYAAPTLGSRISLLAGSVVIASESLDPAVAGMFKDQVAILPDSDTCANLIGQRLTIRLETTMNVTVNHQATDWDDVRLESRVAPEPACIGFIALMMAPRRRGR